MKILVADDHQLIRQGMRLSLQGSALSVQVVEAGSGRETLDAARAEDDLELILLDLDLPDVHGFELLQQLRDEFPHLPLVVVSGIRDSELMQRTIDLGAAGFIPKGAGTEVMLKAIDLVLEGGVYVPPEMLDGSSEEHPFQPDPDGQLKQAAEITACLTDRQLAVLRLLGRGLTNRAIGDELGLSQNTVKVHVTSILRKLELENRTQASLLAQQLGLVEPAGD